MAILGDSRLVDIDDPLVGQMMLKIVVNSRRLLFN